MQNPYIGIFLLKSTFWCCKSFVNTLVFITIDFQTANSLCRREWEIDNRSLRTYYIRYCPFFMKFNSHLVHHIQKSFSTFSNKFITMISRDIQCSNLSLLNDVDWFWLLSGGCIVMNFISNGDLSMEFWSRIVYQTPG